MFNILKKKDGFSYIEPMKKAAKVVLANEYASFENEVNLALREKEPTLIGSNDKKYYLEYIAEDDYEKENKRYLLMAKEKDIKILKRDGLDILEVEVINYVGDDIEKYFFDVAQITEKLICIDTNELQEKIELLVKRNNIDFSFSYLKTIQDTFKDNNAKYSIEHEALGYSSEIWRLEKIESFKQTAAQLKEKGYIFFLSNYRSDARWFGLIKKSDFKFLKNLKRINVITIEELMTENIGERFLTTDEKFDIFYQDIMSEIDNGVYEIVYKIDASLKPTTSLSQIGGQGIGVDDASYPMMGNKPMQHACTFDMQDFSTLKERYRGIRAISLYISSFDENEAYEANNNETKVLFLSQQDIDTKKYDLDVELPIEPLSIQIKEVKVPKGLLAEDTLDMDENSWRYELHNYFYNFNYIGGQPIWMQDDSHKGEFIAQFDESLFEAKGSRSGDMNFGGGIMYMLENTAFWQCG